MYTIETEKGISTFLHMVKSAGTSIHTAFIEADLTTHVNQRHAHIRNLPEQYQDFPKLIVIRKPDEWYKSFYRFFLEVEGYLSFMLHDLADDGYIYPIPFDEFVKRSLNLKDTLMKYPNKARVFRNLLRSQGNMHFVTGYFESDFNVNDEDSMEQFNMSLYEWFWKAVGGADAINIPMNKLGDVEDYYGIKIPHENKTPKNRIEVTLTPELIDMIHNNDKKFYDMINNYSSSSLIR